MARAAEKFYTNAARYRVYGYRRDGCGPWLYAVCRASVWRESLRSMW